jgi:hypothetical protein
MIMTNDICVPDLRGVGLSELKVACVRDASYNLKDQEIRTNGF